MILVIESTCDESSVALMTPGPQVVHELTASQEKVHAPWGGVVPELASRTHQESLLPLVAKCLREAKVSLNDVDAIAVAHKPGLLGPLLVGVTLAKTLAFSLNKPLIGVDHLHGHMASVKLENKEIPDKTLGLLVSGGHSLILDHVKGRWKILGGTRDDAAGEAFDKGARLFGLPYPGGRLLSELAAQGDPSKIPFPVSEIESLQLSFSGLKSELRRRIEAGILKKETREDVAAGYQEAIVEALLRPLSKQIKKEKPEALVITGGVSCNERLRARASDLCGSLGLSLLLAEKKWCTDNAAMIGAAALEKWKRQEVDDLTLEPQPKINPRQLLEAEVL